MRLTTPVGLSVLLLSFFGSAFLPSVARSAPSQNEPTTANQAADSKVNDSKITDKQYPAGLIALTDDQLFSAHSFVVDKSKRTLSVYEWRNNDLDKIAEYPADIGKKAGDKEKRNDARTPVGIYFLQKEMTQPEIPFGTYGSLAFSTDYPNIFDQREGKDGSGIWLHAVPDSVPLTRGSRGCVVVRNDVIRTLKQYVKLEQTPVLIFDEVKYLNQAQYLEQRQKYLQDFENWRVAWEKQDVDSYIKYYDETFRNDQMNYRQWYRHKKRLKKLYSSISVQLSPPMILEEKDQIVIRTIQRYKSNLHSDYGEKTIHARLSADTGFKIIREDWKPLPDPLASQNNTVPKNKEPLEKQAALQDTK
jgi:murein L,D-transpeptidase YafK